MLAKPLGTNPENVGRMPEFLVAKGEGSNGGVPRVKPIYKPLKVWATSLLENNHNLGDCYKDVNLFLSDLLEGNVRSCPAPRGRMMKVFLIKQQENLCVD